MAGYQKTEKWTRWKGYKDDIVAAAKAAMKAIKTDTGQEPPPSIIAERANLETRFDGLDDLESNLSIDDLRSFDRLSVDIGNTADLTAASARIVFSRVSGEPAVQLITRSTNRDQAERAGLKDLLERGKRRLQVSDGAVGWMGLILLLLLVGLWNYFSYFINFPDVHPLILVMSGTILGGAIGFLVVWGSAKLVGWLVPTLELLAPGESTRWERSRRWVLSAVGTAVLIPLVGIIMQQMIGGD